MTLSLAELLDASILKAAQDQESCAQELRGAENPTLFHRDSFHYIAKGSNTGFYADPQDSELVLLAQRAREVINQREKAYDAVSRKYLDVADMSRILGDDSLLKGSRYINGADVSNYVALVHSQTGNTELFQINLKIGREVRASQERRDSVQTEMRILQEYIQLCEQRKGYRAFSHENANH